MVTTNIGVRELKRDAPRLIKRAAKGEHIVISRYGQPLAVLGPVRDPAAHPRMVTWRREHEAFQRLAPTLALRYRGKYVAIAGSKVVDSDSSHERLYLRVERKLGETVFFVGAVRRAEAALQMPGFSQDSSSQVRSSSRPLSGKNQ